MRNGPEQICTENQNTHFMFNNFFFQKAFHLLDNVANIIERGKPQMTIWRMRVAGWISNDTSTHSEYLIALPL
jgi:hypothetical protein